MNLLNHLSWSAYLELIAAALVIYYSYVALRFYRADISHFAGRLIGTKTAGNEDPFLSSPVNAAEDLFAADGAAGPPYSNVLAADEALTAAETIIAGIKTLAAEVAGEPHPSVIAPVWMQELLSSCRDLPEAYRDAINHTVVAECKKYGIALLSEDEVNEWW